MKLTLEEKEELELLSKKINFNKASPDDYARYESLLVKVGFTKKQLTQVMYDNGTHGDTMAGDGLYTFDYVLPSTATESPPT